MIVTSADALHRTLRRPTKTTVVVSFTDPNTEPPAAEGVEQHVIRVADITIDDSEWIVRFGGLSTDLFQAADTAVLLDVAERHKSSGIVVHCGAGIARSTAAAVIIAAAQGVPPAEAVADAARAQKASFRWRPPTEFAPNERILRIGSEVMYGDDRLLLAWFRWRYPDQ